MNNTFTKKIVSLLLLMMVGTTGVWAQNHITPLTKAEVQNEMDQNKINGHPYYQGLFSEYKITTTTTSVSATDSAMVVNSIKSNPDVISCVYSPQRHSLNVKAKKQESGTVLKQIKTSLITHQVAITQLEEVNYKLN